MFLVSFFVTKEVSKLLLFQTVFHSFKLNDFELFFKILNKCNLFRPFAHRNLAEEEKYGFPNVISTEPCYSAKEDRIVQGKIAPGGAFPYQASLRVRENYHVCGGSIISDRWILTAGHCLYG